MPATETRPLAQRLREAPTPVGNAGATDHCFLACVDDPATAVQVVAHALELARSLDSPLVLARTLTPPRSSDNPIGPLGWELRRREARAKLAELAAALSPEPFRLETVLIEGPAETAAAEWADEHLASVIAVAARDSGGGDGLIGRRILESGDTSLLFVPVSAVESGDYHRVLVPLDGSLCSESILPVAALIARAADAELVLVHVVPPPLLLEAAPKDCGATTLMTQIDAYNELNARSYLDRLVTRLRGEQVFARALVTHGGDPRSRLKALIRDEDCDLVVMSARGRSNLVDVSCGSVTDYLIAHSSVPLLVVRRDPRHDVVPAVDAAARHRVAA